MLVKPEEVGLSSQCLERIGTHLQRYIDAGKVAGTLTLVARHGQIAYFEPQGILNSNAPDRCTTIPSFASIR